jgi:small GTP-binding protein
VARLGWLHLSDLYLGTQGTSLIQPVYREAFEKDLRRLHEQSGPWDVVFISGDLTMSGSPREFELLNSTLTSLWGYLRSLGSDPCLLVVPGNHDMWRGATRGEDPGRYQASDVRRAFRLQGESQLTRVVSGGFAAFRDWFDGWRRAHLSPVLGSFNQGLLPGDFAATIVTQGLKVGVLGLNSNFLSERDSARRLREIDLEQVEAATRMDPQEWGLQHDAVLLLTHHAPSALHSMPFSELGSGLTPKTGLLLHLCGSRHAVRASSSEAEVQTPWSHVIRSPSLFGGAIPEDERWGYTAGEIDLSGPKGFLRLFPRAATLRRGSVVLGPDEDIANPDGFWAMPIVRQTPKHVAAATAHRIFQESVRLAKSRDVPEFLALKVVRPSGSLPPGVKLQAVLGTGEEMVGCLAWDPSGEALAIGLSGGQLTYWKLGEATSHWTVRDHEAPIVDLCISPSAGHLASRSERAVHLWRVDGTRVEAPQPLIEGGNVLAWSPTGQLVAENGRGSLQAWDPPTWTAADEVPLEDNPEVVYSLAWSPDGGLLACGGSGVTSLVLYRSRSNRVTHYWGVSSSPDSDALDVAWHPVMPWLAVAYRNKTVRVLHLEYQTINIQAVLEGHTDAVTSVSFSFDGRLLASKSLDGTIRLWRTDTWEEVAQLGEPGMLMSNAGLAFSPTQNVLATLEPWGHGVRLWELDVAVLLGAQAKASSATVHEVSAKVVLVGEGRAGKSCLAQRMVEDQYEEQDSTHGMRFWSMPAARSGPAQPSSENWREIVLWDLGGQSEYQLVHQLFLRDSTVALMVMEPGRGERALEEIEGWDRRLRAQAGERRIRKLLVGSKVDNPEAPVNRPALEALVKRLEFEAPYLLTSARTGHGISALKAALEKAIDWDTLEKVSRPELFQRIREIIQRLREARRVVLTFYELESELRGEMGSAFDPDALQAVVSHLTRQGRVADTRMAGGTRVLILEVEQIERYAGSLILAARENPHGVPAIEVSKVLSPRMKFPRIKDSERLREDQELPVLNCVIELLIEHGVCLRHEGLLIFPSLFQPTHGESEADFAHAISMHYDFFGPIDNIYASLITSLAVSRHFGPMRLWENRAEFGQAGKDSSGVRRVRSQSQGARGIAQLDVFFDEGTDPKTRELFVNFVEQHLRENGVELLERLTVTCACGENFSEEVVRKRLSGGKTDIVCPVCERRTQLTPGARQSLERNPALAQEIQALRTTIREQRTQTATEVKVTMSGEVSSKPAQEAPIRILHLSDLHIGAETDPLSLLQPLAADLHDREEGLAVDRLDYLVISGDITNRASPQEFEKAYEFVSGLIKEFELTAQRCIIVPGNHDLDWGAPAYAWKSKRDVGGSKLAPGTYQEAGPGYLVRDDARYPERFKNFSEHFFHRLTQRPYPLTPEEQCLPFLFGEDRLQFLAMNSAWEIDEYFQERSSISDKAVSRGLDAADKEIARAQAEGKLPKEAKVLRLAVWHHPITGNEKIQADAFMERLRKASVRFCLHGHVHEERADLVNYLDPKRSLHVVGAGSFGAPVRERPESVPRLYNLMEVQRDLQQVRIHTRSRRKQEGAWEGWAVWKGLGKGEKRSFYDVPLP